MNNQTQKKDDIISTLKEPYEVVQTKFEAYTGDEPYLFVSYSHRDSKKVYPNLDAMHDKKYRIWNDESC